MEVEGSYCGDEIDFAIMCFCGQIAPLTKSKSTANSGRRFFGCSNYMYDPSPILKKRGVLRPMKIWKATEVAKASEQAESSSTPLKKNEEIHSERNPMQVKIEKMQVEIDQLKAANIGTSKWKILFYGVVGLLMAYLYTSVGKDNHLALP